MSKSPVIGIALGSGAAKGFAHIGVLKALDENGINVDIIAGCSAGALIGGLYCCGIQPIMIESIADKIDKKLWMDITIPKQGILKGKKIEDMLKMFTKGKNIEQLDKKFIAISTDLKSSQKYVFDKGPIYKAIRASISIPGVFEPVTMGDKVLVDGAVVDRVPVSELRKLGADIIISVDLGITNMNMKNIGILDIIIQSIDLLTKQAMKSKKLISDISINPDLNHISPSKFDLVKECSEIGYKATIEKIDEIKSIIKLQTEKSSI